MEKDASSTTGASALGDAEAKSAAPSANAASETVKPAAKPPHSRRNIIVAAVVLIVLAVAGRFILEALNTESTDDAYVNSHVTFVAPRVSGQVAEVRVDDNNRVRKGDVIVVLDKEPYRVQLSIKQATLAAARADMIAAQASVRGQVAQTRSARFKLQHAIEDVDNKVALLRANVAALDKAKSTEDLAQKEYDRYKQLLATKVASKEEYDQHRTTLDAAKAEVDQAQENIAQTRVLLGLPAKPEEGKSLSDVPNDLGQTFSSVKQAQSDLLSNAALLGIIPSSYNMSPKETIAEFYRRDPTGNLDQIYAAIIKSAPAIKQAEAKLLQAQSDVDQAELNLRYCDIVAEIDGVITNRNVNPGNNVQIAQSLMAIRSLTEVWVDANFKETQLKSLRIGQPVDLETDMYGGHYTFKGRISGFTMGTGSTLALLPAENATGNFIKVVQRLPVRIDLVDYKPDQVPLFVGLSVEPKVHIKEQPTGPDAGKFLQMLLPLPTAATAPTPNSPPPAPAKP